MGRIRPGLSGQRHSSPGEEIKFGGIGPLKVALYYTLPSNFSAIHAFTIITPNSYIQNHYPKNRSSTRLTELHIIYELATRYVEKSVENKLVN